MVKFVRHLLVLAFIVGTVGVLSVPATQAAPPAPEEALKHWVECESYVAFYSASPTVEGYAITTKHTITCNRPVERLSMQSYTWPTNDPDNLTA